MKNKNGFTLAELLIVVAIIAVLVGISIPVFTSQLEKSKESKDLANVRAKYAEIMILAQGDEEPSTDSDISREGDVTNYVYKARVSLSQDKPGWSTSLPITLGGITYTGENNPQWLNEPGDKKQCTITYSKQNNLVTLNWNGGDSPAVYAAKTYSQTQATNYLNQLEEVILKQAVINSKGDLAAYKVYLESLPVDRRKFTFNYGQANEIVCWYKTDASQIDTMEKAGTGTSLQYINFTLDDDGKVAVFNYVDSDYSFSSENTQDTSVSWIGTAKYE